MKIHPNQKKRDWWLGARGKVKRISAGRRPETQQDQGKKPTHLACHVPIRQTKGTRGSVVHGSAVSAACLGLGCGCGFRMVRVAHRGGCVGRGVGRGASRREIASPAIGGGTAPSTGEQSLKSVPSQGQANHGIILCASHEGALFGRCQIHCQWPGQGHDQQYQSSGYEDPDFPEPSDGGTNQVNQIENRKSHEGRHHLGVESDPDQYQG